MAQDFIKEIEQKLGVPALQKLDPNDDSVPSGGLLLSQAAIPAMLAGLFSVTRTEDSTRQLLANSQLSWLDRIFAARKKEIVSRIASHSNANFKDAADLMEATAAVAVENLSGDDQEAPTAENLSTALSRHRHEILVYLPASLQMGNFLNDTTMDDPTNKMEGPVSNLVHRIEDHFSGAGK